MKTMMTTMTTTIKMVVMLVLPYPHLHHLPQELAVVVTTPPLFSIALTNKNLYLTTQQKIITAHIRNSASKTYLNDDSVVTYLASTMH